MILKKLSIIIPAFNEGKTIQQVLQNLVDLKLNDGIEKELLVINDFSSDNTSFLIDQFISENKNSEIQLFNQLENKGKGAAIHKGIEMATGDYIVIQDADLELNPTDINRLLDCLISGKSSVVYGSRFLTNNHKNTNFVWHILGNGFLTKLSNLFTGFRLTDMMTCYKLIPSEVLKSMHLKEMRFGFEPEVTLKLSKINNLTIQEVPISYDARSKTEGKKISAKDGFRVIYCILKYKFSN
jgi:glycosyltransferase involved in cell wall biosynthesis